jgi:hypothetical protein
MHHKLEKEKQKHVCIPVIPRYSLLMEHLCPSSKGKRQIRKRELNVITVAH